MDLKHGPRNTIRGVRAGYRILSSFIPKKQEKHNLPSKLTVSLTSYPKRYKTLYLVLKSIIDQSVKPDNIILWIARQDLFDLPDILHSLKKKRLIQIRHVDRDIGPHKKLIPTLQVFPNDFITICDDDMLYPRNWLKELVDAWRFPNEGVAKYAKVFTIDDSMRPTPVWYWPNARIGSSSRFNMPIGSNGVLYPPNFFNKEIFNTKLAMNIAPTGDDLWFFWNFKYNNKILRIKNKGIYHCPGTQWCGLKHYNDDQGGNDKQVKKLTYSLGLPMLQQVE